MITDKLYDRDSHISRFSAYVISCAAQDNVFKTVLDRTAFFPEGGGQPSDTGTLGDVAVFDVKIENGEIYHYTRKPLTQGQAVRGQLDFDRRHAFMQNHTGEHIVSGIVNKEFGFNNVGFHLSEEFVTLDFDGELTRRQLDAIEDSANRIVWENREVKAYYPTSEELMSIKYRSKKELSGEIRIVDIEGTDICACCAPHVKRTGEIGIIKLLETERMRGGTRIVMKCGAYALDDYRNKYSNIYKISKLLSARQNTAAEAVESLIQRADSADAEISALKRKTAQIILDSANADTRIIFADGLAVRELQSICDSLHKTYGGLRAAFSASADGFNFVLCDREDELQETFSRFKSRFNVRGGGRGNMVQGAVTAARGELEEFFKEVSYGLD